MGKNSVEVIIDRENDQENFDSSDEESKII
jgi:hypothetical protein